MSLSNKIDFAVIFKVTNANPNGDPLNGNRPRITYEGFGEVSDVCIKRKLRNRLMQSDIPVFVQSDDNKVDDYTSLRERLSGTLPKVTSKDELVTGACENWFDTRAFGQLFAFKKKESTKGKKNTETGENTEDTGVSVGIRGPVSIQSAYSIEPINISSIQITKSVNSEGDGVKKGSDTMGQKHSVDKGIYLFCGSINPQLAVKTGFSDSDAEVIKKLLPTLFENDASSARPEGSMEVLKVIWWKHNNSCGQISAAKIHHSFKVDPDGLVIFDENKGPTDSLGNWPTPEVIEGV